MPVSSFRLRGARIGKGMRSIKINDGDSVAAAVVVGASKTGCEGEDLLISTMNGNVLRVPLSQCKVFSRVAKGNIVVKLREGDEVSAVTAISVQKQI